jgi:hypothetical protein
MFLETNDGVAILGYAGIGLTAGGTEPSDWMSAVLRGRNVPLEQSIGILADALKAQFPRHMRGMPVPSHTVVIPAFLKSEVKLYTIDLVLSSKSSSQMFRWGHYVVGNSTRTPRMGLAGSGAAYLVQNKKKWMRPLLRLVKACDRQQVQELAVADYLANLNNEVHLHDKSVGPRCVVAWRHRKEGVRNGGGAHQFYTDTVRDASSPALPNIGAGIDIAALVDVMTPRWTEMFKALRAGQPAKDWTPDEINAALARIPDTPDENLR